MCVVCGERIDYHDRLHSSIRLTDGWAHLSCTERGTFSLIDATMITGIRRRWIESMVARGTVTRHGSRRVAEVDISELKAAQWQMVDPSAPKRKKTRPRSVGG